MKPEFRTAWAKHNVRLHHTGRKSFHHPAIGVLTLDFDAMELPAQPGLTLTAYSAAPGTPEYNALRLLASWAATEITSPSWTTDRESSARGSEHDHEDAGRRSRESS